MKDLFKKILKAIVGVLLPLIIDEIKKLIEAWLASPAATAKTGSFSISDLNEYISSDKFANIVKSKIDNLP